MNSEDLLRFDTGTVSDALQAAGGPPGLIPGCRPLPGVGPVAGPVIPVSLIPAAGRCSTSHFAAKAIAGASPGEILLIDNAGRTDRACFGGLLAAASTRASLGGAVVHGAVRDVDAVLETRLPVFAAATHPASARGRYIELAGGPVVIGPTTVNARNLAANPAVTIHLESGEDAVILEGRAEPVGEPSLVARINEVYVPKYDENHPMQHFYALRTNVAFAWLCRGTGRSAERDFQGSPTRWRFARG